jgi:hypothetical protein
MNQKMMFENGEDLPIFSGTPQVAHDYPPEVHPLEKQDSMFTCKVCSDSGLVKNGDRCMYCTCTAGDRQKRVDQISSDAHDYLFEFSSVAAGLMYQKFSEWVRKQPHLFPDFASAWTVYQEERL